MKTYKIGERYQVKRLSADIDQHFRQKLLSMGFIPGAIIHIMRVAPLGDPLQVEIKGCQLSIRRRDLEKLALEKVSDDN